MNRYTLYGFVAIILWSTTVAIIRSITEQVGPLTAAASVYLLGGIVSLGSSLRSENRTIGMRGLSVHYHYLVGCGALFVLYMFALYLAIGLARDRYQVLEIGLVNYLWPALTLVFSLLLLDKRARLWFVPGTVLALLGVFLVLTQERSLSWASFSRNLTSNPLAYALAGFAALSWGLYSNLTRRWGGPTGEGAVPWFMLATGFVLLVLRLLRPEPSLWSVRAAAEILFMGLATSVAYTFWDLAMRKGDMVLVAACSYFIPMFSTLVSCLYFGIMAGIKLWIGCGLIILGSLISWVSVSDAEVLDSVGPRGRRGGL